MISANPTLPKIADDHPSLRPSLATAPRKGRATRGATLPPSYTITWDTTDLPTYRRFIDEVIGRRNARVAPRIDIERASLQPLPPRRTQDFEEVIVAVTSSSGFVLRKVFYTVPSRLIGHRLRVRIHDDRLDIYLGGSLQMTVPRGRSHSNGRHGHVVDYRHIIHALRRKPMALMGLVYRDKLFPREPYARTFEVLTQALPARRACRIMVELLSLAHERACEAELADYLAQDLQTGRLPDLDVLRDIFSPDPQALPEVRVVATSLGVYDELVELPMGAAA